MTVLGAAMVVGTAVSSATGSPTLESMVQSSTPVGEAVRNGKPTVMEFYGSQCSRCRAAAKELRPVEEQVLRDGSFNWVMINTDDPRWEPVWTMYKVDELPHFEFFDASGAEVGWEAGQVDKTLIQGRMAQAQTRPVIAAPKAQSNAVSEGGAVF